MQTQAPLEQRKHTKAKVAGAAALAAILALSSTFAWTSFSQEATNEFRAEANAGGRLHDDFSFTQEVKNKDIYVENFTSEEDGAPIFARVQLKEYLEIGARAGQPETDDPAAKGVVRYPESATMDDTSAWTVYTPADTSSIYRERFTWSEGGSSTFMPTFNKNKDSLEADINGSYRDENGPYTNYTAYTDGQTLEGSAIYDADDNAIDEGDQGVEGTNFTTATETHTAKATGTATVMSMVDWIAAGSQPGPYWVYDTDGWAYWAQAIQPGEATGLLLDNVDLKAPTGDTWYYGIHATGEFVSNGEWKQDGSSYYMDQAATKAITSDAFTLLDRASQALDDSTFVWRAKLAAAPTANEADALGNVSQSLVMIGDASYYKLAQAGDNVLLLNQYGGGIRTFGPTNIWRDSDMRSYLNGEYFDSLPAEIRSRVVQTEITTASTFNRQGDFITTSDHVFLLSEADIFGAAGEYDSPQEFTVNGDIVPTSIHSISNYQWLRSPRYSSSHVASVNNASHVNSGASSTTGDYRPAMWVSVA